MSSVVSLHCTHSSMHRIAKLDIRISANVLSPVTTLDVIACLGRVVERFALHPKTYASSFARVGVVNGAPDCKHFTPETYAIGMPYRDKSLPLVTKALLAQVRCVSLITCVCHDTFPHSCFHLA